MADNQNTIVIQKLTSDLFQEFGDVIETRDNPQIINNGFCERHSDLARVDFDSSGRGGVSLFVSKIRVLPYEFTLMERHPLGSQSFLPLGFEKLLVIVAQDQEGTPRKPLAFETLPGQGINILRGIWHGVLTPLSGDGKFAVFDWIGNTNNLETYEFADCFRVVRDN